MHSSQQPSNPARKFLVDEEGGSFYESVLVASLTVVVGIIVLLALGQL